MLGIGLKCLLIGNGAEILSSYFDSLEKLPVPLSVLENDQHTKGWLKLLSFEFKHLIISHGLEFTEPHLKRLQERKSDALQEILGITELFKALAGSRKIFHFDMVLLKAIAMAEKIGRASRFPGELSAIVSTFMGSCHGFEEGKGFYSAVLLPYWSSTSGSKGPKCSR